MATNMIKISALMLLITVALLVLGGQNSALASVAPGARLAAPILADATETITPTETLAATKQAPAQSTATDTATSEPATATSEPATETSEPATATSEPPTATKAPPTATNTPKSTFTPAPATATETQAAASTKTPTVEATATATSTVGSTETPTPFPTIIEANTATPTATPTKVPVRALAPRSGLVTSLSTSFVVQNEDPSVSATITATFYYTDGTTVSPAVTATVGPYRATTIDQRATGGGLDGISSWQGSVVLSSDTQVASVVNEFGGNTTLGSAFRLDAYNGLQPTDADTTIIMPQLMKNVYDTGSSALYNSLVSIQNTGSADATSVTVTYYNTPCTPSTQSHSIPTIHAGSAYALDLQNDLSCVTATAQGYWLGAATINSDQAVAVVVNQNAPGVLTAYRGFSPTNNAGQRLLIPQVMRSVLDQTGFTWGTSFLVMTADQSTTDVTATFYSTSGSFSITKSAYPLALFDQRFDLQGRFFGTAVVQAAGNVPIVAIVYNQTGFISGRGVQVCTSRSFVNTAGTQTAYVPEVYKNHVDSSGVTMSTSMLAEFAGTVTPLVVTYYPSDGSAAFSTTMNPTAGVPLILVDQRFDGNVPSGFVGSAVLTSSQPFSVNVNLNGGNADPGDTAGVFAGVSQ